MPLSNNATYGVVPMTESINNLPSMPTQIRESGLFVPDYLTTTYVDVESKSNQLTLVQSATRGTPGKPVNETRGGKKTFETVHLPKDDVVRADDVQNVKAFGTSNTATAVNDKVNAKLEGMKSDIDYTREHLQLGALRGKLLDADGSLLYDFYKEFGIQRPTFTLNLTNKDADIGGQTDKMLRQLLRALSGDVSTGWIAFAGEDFMDAYSYHPAIKALYDRYKESVGQYTGSVTANMAFQHRGVTFVPYLHQFGSEVDIKPDEALIAPLGTRKTLKEYFAPADFNETVNTSAKPYYAAREPLKFNKGWQLHAQSNPLPIALRPKALATLKMS
ncbi:major capsid protein [Moraxella osloensis]|nr:major capsid protein [Moraxella osloensis]UAY37045.1 major capsid protein [Moraxella osloensis]